MSAVRIEGRLARAARGSTGPDGSAYLVVEVTQGSDTTAAVARWLMGKGHAAQWTRDRTARRLQQGARVVVHAAGLDVDAHAQQVVLLGVDLIEQIDIPAPLSAQPEANPEETPA